MEPLPFSEYDDADGDRIPVHVGGLSSPDPWPQSASASSPPAWHPSPAMSPSSDVDPGNLQTYTPTSATSAILGTGHAPAGLPVAPRDWMVDPFSQPAVPPAHQEPSQTVATQPAPAATPPPVTTAPAHDPWAEASTAIHVSGPVASVAGRADPTVIETYRSWVTGQTLGHDAFQPLAVRDRFDEWFLLSASGVASLLAWTHEDHGATYSAETWVDQILPSQGISIADRQLAMDLLRAAALHAGGLHTAPTDRLMAYHPADLVTAMGTLHVGLLRLYSSLEGVHPGKVLRDQLGDSHDLNAIAAPNRPNWQPPRS